jgi:hypothetical protein
MKNVIAILNIFYIQSLIKNISLYLPFNFERDEFNFNRSRDSYS